MSSWVPLTWDRLSFLATVKPAGTPILQRVEMTGPRPHCQSEQGRTCPWCDFRALLPIVTFIVLVSPKAFIHRALLLKKYAFPEFFLHA